MSYPLQAVLEDAECALDVAQVSVRSENKDNVWYEVVLFVGRKEWDSCTCPHYRNRRPAGGCKHITSARLSAQPFVVPKKYEPYCVKDAVVASVEQRLERLEAETRELYARLHQRDKAFDAIRQAYIGRSD